MVDLKDLLPVFREVLENDSIILAQETTAADVEGWDSLSHIYLVVAIEKKFKIKFTTQEIQGWKNVGEILKNLNRKLSAV